MNNLKLVLAFSLMFVTLSACGGEGGQESIEPSDPAPDPGSLENTDPLEGFVLIDKIYTKSDEDIVNPARGFYRHTETLTSFFSPLNKSDLIANRNIYQSANANYSVNSSVVFRAYILDSYVDTAVLSESTLLNIRADFDTVREAGVKMVLRFYYHKNASGPDYGDPEKEIILSHIDQLSPILKDNSDVILAIQQGFIGAWGEQYYSDNFSPAAAVTASYTDQNWIDRSDVLGALLEATAETTMVQVRMPQAKQKFLYGEHAPVTSGMSGTPGSLTAETAFSTGNIARIGFHNDCFLTDASDTGTYFDYGTSGGNRNGNAAVILKNYHKNDSPFVVVGGETCKDEDWATPPVAYANDCSDGVVNTMDEFDYSYLNADYNNSVNNDWADGGNTCMDEIKTRLGYRLALTISITVSGARAGNYVPFLFSVDNDGFTSPVTPMELRLILKNQDTGEETGVTLNAERNDVRSWQPGSTDVTEYIKLPDDLPVGHYDLFLHIADISNNGVIASRPEYSIQLANVGMWDATTGYNNLQQSIVVDDFVATDVKNIEPTAHLLDSNESAEPAVVYMAVDGDAADWVSIPIIASAEGQQAASLKVIASDAYLYMAIAGNGMASRFNLFINADGDSATGFQSSDWALSGADYLIEGSVSGVANFYKSAGTEWIWEPQASSSLEVNSSDTFIEAKIGKADFEDLGSTISFGFNDVNTDWNVQSRLPLAGEAMPSYGLPSAE